MSPRGGVVNVDNTLRQADDRCPPSPTLPMNKRSRGILKPTTPSTVPIRFPEPSQSLYSSMLNRNSYIEAGSFSKLS